MAANAGTAFDLPTELAHKHEHDKVWDLRRDLKAAHVPQGVGLCHKACLCLFRHHKRPDNSYVECYRCSAAKLNASPHPTNCTAKQIIDKQHPSSTYLSPPQTAH
jgi:hypothetical protein